MKNYCVIRWFVLVFSVALLAGCANTISRLKGPDAELRYANYVGEPVTSFWFSSFDGWTSISDDQVIIRVDMNKEYLVKVVGYCPNINFATRVGVTSAAGHVDKFEKIIVDHDRCMISEIRPIDVARMRADNKALKQQAPKTV